MHILLLFLIFNLGLVSAQSEAEISKRIEVSPFKNTVIANNKEINKNMIEKSNTLTAIVIGATGAVGSDLVKQLCEDNTFQNIELFVRRNIPADHPKIHVHVIDFDHPKMWKDKVKGDVIFSCLGTTLKQVGTEEAQWKIDHNYPLEFAEAARENGVKKYVLVSSIGADKDSRIFYLKMKGMLEEDIKKLGIPSVAILRPAGLIRKNSDRLREKILIKATQFFNALGLFLAQRPLKTESVASAMINIAKSNDKGHKTFSVQEILDYAK